MTLGVWELAFHFGVCRRDLSAVFQAWFVSWECSESGDWLQPSLASVYACPGTTGVADRTESLAPCCIPEGNCGHKLLEVGKYLSGFQKPARGLAAAEAPGQDLRLAWPSGQDIGLMERG